jgi:hypothetical protein
MKCFNCYYEFYPLLNKPICPHCGLCYYCREFGCFIKIKKFRERRIRIKVCLFVLCTFSLFWPSRFYYDGVYLQKAHNIRRNKPIRGNSLNSAATRAIYYYCNSCFCSSLFSHYIWKKTI